MTGRADMKTCSNPACCQTLPLDRFSRKRSAKDGRQSQCKRCVSHDRITYYQAHADGQRQYSADYHREHREERHQYDAVYRKAHTEKDRQRHAIYRKAHAEEIRQQHKMYVRAHPEKNRQRATAYNQAHPEKHRQCDATYRQANREQIHQRSLAYRQANREKMRQRAIAYNQAHPEKRRRFLVAYRESHRELFCQYAAVRSARKRGAPTCDFTLAQWRAMKDLYQHRCVYCGKSQERLTQDHVVPLAKGGAHTWSNIVPACQSCNSKKGINAPLNPLQGLLQIEAAVALFSNRLPRGPQGGDR